MDIETAARQVGVAALLIWAPDLLEPWSRAALFDEDEPDQVEAARR